MKQFATLACAFALSAVSTRAQEGTSDPIQNNAQQRQSAGFKPKDFRAQLKRNAVSAGFDIASKPTSGNERLLARARYVDGGSTFLDSSVFVYGGQRSSGFNYQTLEYSLYAETDQISGAAFVKYDTAYTHYSNATVDTSFIEYQNELPVHQVIFRSGYVMRYDAENRLISEAGYSTYTLDSLTRDEFTYDGAGRLQTSVWQEWNSGAWEEMEKYEYVYSGTGVMPQYVLTYSAVSGTGWELVDSTTVGHSNGNLTALTSYELSGGSWYPAYKDSMAYDGNQLIWHVSLETSDPDGALLGDTVQIASRELNAGKKPVKNEVRMYDYGEDEWVVTVSTIQYNANGNPVSVEEEGEYIGKTLYYYEPFQSNNVANIATDLLSVNVYPNPVRDMLYIDVTSLQAGNVSMEIVNTAGQRVFAGNVGISGDVVTVPVQSLASGMYQLAIRDVTGRLYHATFVRN